MKEWISEKAEWTVAALIVVWVVCAVLGVTAAIYVLLGMVFK